MLCLHLYVREKMPKSWHILPKSLVFVRQLMMDLFLFIYLFTHLNNCTVITSIKTDNVIKKRSFFLFSKNIEI